MRGKPRIFAYYDDDVAFAKAYDIAHTVKKEKTKDQIIRAYWNSMNNRVKHGIYLKNKITVSWDASEFHRWFNDRWEIFDRIKASGETPSIDRIDPSKNYTSSNCRLIPMSVNSALGELNSIILRMKNIQSFLKANEHWLKEQKA